MLDVEGDADILSVSSPSADLFAFSDNITVRPAIKAYPLLETPAL